MRAYIADIHANAVALQAVFADITRRYGDIPCTCVGDIVDYGAEPAACIKMVRERCDIVLLGNHDDSATAEHTRRGPFSDWTFPRIGRAHRNWLRQLPTQHLDDMTLAAHGCPSFNTNEKVRRYSQLNVYVRQTASNQDMINDLWHILEAHKRTIAAVGHTHTPFILPRRRPPVKVTKDTVTFPHTCPFILSVPSVGQPRDHDPRTGYAVIDDRQATLVRLHYDIEKACTTLTKHAVPHLRTMTSLLRTGAFRGNI